MPKTRPPYSPEFRRQMVDLVRSGRDPSDLAREFEPSAQAIRNWVLQADRQDGRGAKKPARAAPIRCSRRVADWKSQPVPLVTAVLAQFMLPLRAAVLGSIRHAQVEAEDLRRQVDHLGGGIVAADVGERPRDSRLAG